MVNTSCALISRDPVKEIETSSSGHIKIEEMTIEIENLLLEDDEKSEDEYYTLEELFW